MCKEYGVHNGSRGWVREWQLHENDIARLQSDTSAEIILSELPERIITEFEQPLKKQYPGLPPNHFPLAPVSTYWNLSKEGDEPVEIVRKGYPLVPNFSTTIAGATGRTRPLQIWEDTQSLARK